MNVSVFCNVGLSKSENDLLPINNIDSFMKTFCCFIRGYLTADFYSFDIVYICIDGICNDARTTDSCGIPVDSENVSVDTTWCKREFGSTGWFRYLQILFITRERFCGHSSCTTFYYVREVKRHIQGRVITVRVDDHDNKRISLDVC